MRSRIPIPVQAAAAAAVLLILLLLGCQAPPSGKASRRTTISPAFTASGVAKAWMRLSTSRVNATTRVGSR